MRKTELRDIVVFLPGIGGSVLHSGNTPLWEPGAGVAWRFLTRPGSLVERLRLEGDDPQLDVLPDGVRAVDLVQDVHLIPGLWKIDAYSGFRAMVTDAFKVEVGTIRADDERVANYFDFPYDWRRDNRVAARQLKRVVDERLHRWRTETPFKDAKVILVAHSMGGLVARYYVEVLGGWTDCKALVTIGTPHRGSVKAVDFLANGNRLLFADLTDMIRSLPAVYQLLPRYKMVEENGRFCRVTETDAEMPGIDRKRAAEALRFHDEIQAAVEARSSRGYELIPIVGTWQPTMQSARLANGRVTVDELAPTWTEFPEGDGDGTVPRVSAVPVEHSDAWLNTFVAESHSSLQNHAGILQDLQDRLIQSQIRTGHIRGAVAAAQPAPALALHVDDLYAHDERIELQVGVKNIEVGDVTAVRMKVTEAANGVTVHEGPCALSDGVWSGVLSSLPPGTYRVAVTAATALPHALGPVHDVFAVAER